MAEGELKIESGIPIPGDRRRSGIRSALRQMAVGDSFFIGGVNANTRAHNNASQILGKGNYAVRQVEGGYRVWRIK